jgi:hypothetical protein
MANEIDSPPQVLNPGGVQGKDKKNYTTRFMYDTEYYNEFYAANIG